MGEIRGGGDDENVHPLVNVAFRAYNQIQSFKSAGKSGMTEDIFELSEIAIKINNLKRASTVGLKERLKDLISNNFTLYRTSRYEIQIAGTLLEKGHQVSFVRTGQQKTPDILVKNLSDSCEFECKHKDPASDQLDYIKSIYENTQTARKQFSKTCAGIIMIDVDKNRFNDFQQEKDRLKGEIDRAIRNSTSISAILLTSKIAFEERDDYVYRHRALGFLNPKARHQIPAMIISNLINA